MYIFVADIHIRPGISHDSTRFISWLTAIKEQASGIFILGDLFDYWYTGLESRVRDVMNVLDSAAIQIMTGNRDFLLRNNSTTNLNIIHGEEHIIRLYDRKILIAHGHTLTETDTGFKILHRYGWPVLTRIDKCLPVSIKDVIARSLVKSSANIRPLNTCISRDISTRRGAETVICGHLHKELMTPELIVLPPFFDTGRWLAWDADGPRFVSMYSANKITGDKA